MAEAVVIVKASMETADDSLKSSTVEIAGGVDKN